MVISVASNLQFHCVNKMHTKHDLDKFFLSDVLRERFQPFLLYSWWYCTSHHYYIKENSRFFKIEDKIDLLPVLIYDL